MFKKTGTPTPNTAPADGAPANASSPPPWAQNTRGHRHDPIAPVPFLSIPDDYFLWLNWAIPGHQMPGNLYCFDYAIRNLPSVNPIIEIGTFVGLSTMQIAHTKRKHHRTNPFYTCDPWVFEGIDMSVAIGGSPVSFGDYRNFIKNSYVRNAKTFAGEDLPRTVESFSDKFFDAWTRGDEVIDVFGTPSRLGGPIAFAFIDGNHTYDAANRDFENCDRFIERGGFLLFDDSGDLNRDASGRPFDLGRLMDDVRNTGRYELVIQNPNYLWVKK